MQNHSVDNKILNVYSSGKVKGNNDVGGIFGNIYTTWIGTTYLTNAYSTATIEGDSRVGGILGSNNTNATFSNVYALNNGIQGNGTNVGKVVGQEQRNINSGTLTTHIGLRGNAGSQYVDRIITNEQIQNGLKGFEDTET